MEHVDDGFDALVSGTDYPMYIVTVAARGQRAGCLVGFTTQCSIDPPRILVCISKANRTHRVAEQSDIVILHFLAETDVGLARLFGAETGDEIDKFAQCSWHEGPGGAPILPAGRGWLAAAIEDRLDAGDHSALLLSPRQVQVLDPHRPQLSFHHVRSLDAGHPA